MRRRPTSGLIAALVLGALASASSSAFAQGSTAKVSAEALFEEGRRLMSDGKIADACPKFAESQRLDPSPVTLLNLASCYEKSARPATAWATYKEGASSASAAGRQDLVATAQRHAEALLPTLPRMNLTVAAPVDGMTVSLDGVSVGRAEWGIAVPIDPGVHTVDAAAPHFKPWSTKLTVGTEATTTPVAIPALEAAPADVAPPPTPATPSAPPPATTAEPPAVDSSVGHTQRTVGLVLGAVGIVGLGVGAGFAVSAKSQYNGSLSDCLASAPNECSSAGVNERNSAISAGNVASVAVTVGAVALAGGVVLWLTAPTGHASGADRAALRADAPSQSVSVALIPTLGGGVLRATW